LRGSQGETFSPHGSFLAAEVGELAGVSGNTIGQWARWGYIRASQSGGDPHVYSVEDVTEAAMVHTLLENGVSHAQVRRAIAQLGEYGTWPLSEAPLAVTDEPRPRVVLREADGAFALSPRGWQRMVAPPPLEDVRLRLRRS
jgi:DNA-binding transcriptional MerR regulator